MTETQLRALRLLASQGRLDSTQLQRYALRPLDMQALVDLGAADEQPAHQRTDGSTVRSWRPTMRAEAMLGRGPDSRRVGRVGRRFAPPTARPRYERRRS